MRLFVADVACMQSVVVNCCGSKAVVGVGSGRGSGGDVKKIYV